MDDTSLQPWDGITECYRIYRKILLLVIGNHVENVHHAEELLHDLFLKFYENRVPLDPKKATTRGYLVIAARNKAYDFLKKQRWESRNVVNLDMDTVEIDGPTLINLEDAVVEGEIVSTLHDVLRALPEEVRSIYIRKTFLGQTVLQIAKDTGLSVFKVNRALKKSLHALRNGLRDFYYD